MAGENLLVVDDSPTILKVVESALARAGYQVDTALNVESGMALARARRPAVILIDSLLQGDEGNNETASTQMDRQGPTGSFHLCGALAADALLSRTPVVLMTAKGEDLETRYAQASNVIDYITKPFSPDAVLAVVTHAIEKTRTVAPSPEATSRGGAGEMSVVAQALSRSTAPASVNVLNRFRDTLAERLEPHWRKSGSRDLTEICKRALPDDALTALLAVVGLGPSGEDAGGDADLSGQLAATSLSEILTLLGQQSQTGTLRVFTDGARVEIFFRKGHIDFAAAVGVAEEFLLGRFAVASGDIAPDALARVLDARARLSEKPPLFGRDLVVRGLITSEQLKSAMRRQTAELVYESLRWSRGTFRFKRSDELPELAQEAALAIAVDALLLEGFRRVDEWRLIERDIQSFDLVFVRAEDRIADLPRGTLTRDEIAVLDALSGKNSVRDVVRSLRMGSFDVSKILYRLLRTKLIRRRVQPIATH